MVSYNSLVSEGHCNQAMNRSPVNLLSEERGTQTIGQILLINNVAIFRNVDLQV